MKEYDIILIGTGQATGTLIQEFVKKKLSIAVVEENRVGGSCVNWGCTPTKTMIAGARAAHMVRRSKDFGIEVSGMKTDFSKVMARVNDIRNTASSGFRSWLEKVTDFYPVHGEFLDDHTILAGDSKIRGKTLVIHTGAHSRKPDIPGIDDVRWLDNRGILDLTVLPEHLLVIGGSYIGLEFGQAFRRFGSRVTVFEPSERIIVREDPGISDIARELLEAEGIAINVNSSITGLEQHGGEILLNYTQNGTPAAMSGTHLLVATGRSPATENLGLENAGIETNRRGYITVDDYGRTSRPHVYALGDVNGRGAFTHTSVHDGQVFLDHFFGKGNKRISDRTMIYSMYIDPPLARVGMDETEAAKSGVDCLVGSMPMSDVSRAKEKSETWGTMKVVVEKESKKILGATIFGVGGDEIIGMLALSIQGGLPYTTLQNTVIPHPTVAELVPWIFDNLKLPAGR